MIEYPITEEMLALAKANAEEMGTLKNSITSGDGNIAGFLGELIALDILKAKRQNTYDYDLVLPTNKTVDVKTKRTKYKPLVTYDCSVAAFNTKQKCDYYCFVRIKEDFTVGWYLGLIPKDEYFKKSVFLNKGDFDNSNKYTVKADCYNLKIEQL
jgi:hypothetical protein